LRDKGTHVDVGLRTHLAGLFLLRLVRHALARLQELADRPSVLFKRVAEVLAHGDGHVAMGGRAEFVAQDGFQIDTHGLRGGVACRSIACEGTGDDGIQAPRRIDTPDGQRRHIGPDDVLVGLGVVGTLEEPAAGDHLPDHHTHRPEVGATVDGLCHELLRRHVGQFALEHPGACGFVLGGRLGDAKIEHLGHATHGDKEIRRGHVAVHDIERGPVVITEFVRIVEPGEAVAEHPEQKPER